MAIRELSVLILLCSPSVAATQDQVCAKYGEVAKAFMKARQNGVELPTIMAAANSDAMRQMVLMAYDEPRYQTPENRDRAVADFGNDMALACYKDASAR